MAQPAQTGIPAAKEKASVRMLKRKVAIARFTNETNYGRSFLVDKDANPIGKQAVDILSKKLLDTGKFILLERADMEKINAELGLGKLDSLHNMADYLVVGRPITQAPDPRAAADAVVAEIACALT